jgi:hypothetical protein
MFAPSHFEEKEPGIYVNPDAKPAKNKEIENYYRDTIVAWLDRDRYHYSVRSLIST